MSSGRSPKLNIDKACSDLPVVPDYSSLSMKNMQPAKFCNRSRAMCNTKSAEDHVNLVTGLGASENPSGRYVLPP